jgi:AraC family transcriptional regulator, transcriptional activator of pobA
MQNQPLHRSLPRQPMPGEQEGAQLASAGGVARGAEVRASKLSELLPGDGAELRLTSSDTRQLLYVHAGRGSIELDGSLFEARPGTSVSVPAGTVCILRFHSGSEGFLLQVGDIYFRSHVATALPALISNSAPYWRGYFTPLVFADLLPQTQRKRRDALMAELLATRSRLGLGCDPAVAAYLLLIMFEPQLQAAQERHKPDIVPHARAAGRRLVLEFRSLVNQNFARHWQVSAYCAWLNVTTRGLSQACVEATGVKPLTLIHERLVLQAERELLYSSKTVGTIAAVLGFRDVAYFSRFIKQHTGKSPTELRRHVRRQRRGVEIRPARPPAAVPMLLANNRRTGWLAGRGTNAHLKRVAAWPTPEQTEDWQPK